MTFAEFASCAREWSHRRVALRAEMPPPASAAAPPLAPSAGETLQPPTTPPALAAELASLVDWAWLASEVQAPLRLGRVLSVALHACSPCSVRPLQGVRCETLLCQVRGRSRVLLVSPAYTYDGLYPYPVAHPYDGYAMVDVGAPNLGEWPAFAKVKGSVAMLAPGDLLLVPRGWWMQLQALPDSASPHSSAGGGDEHTLLQLSMASGAKIRPAAAATPAIGRVVEQLAVEVEGVSGARAWLERLATGKPAPADEELATVRGYKRIRLTTAIWKEVAGLAPALSRTQAAAFLAALIERRMLPTPWLNANYREPLYLTGATARRRHCTVASSAAARSHPYTGRLTPPAVGRRARAVPGHAQ